MINEGGGLVGDQCFEQKIVVIGVWGSKLAVNDDLRGQNWLSLVFGRQTPYQ